MREKTIRRGRRTAALAACLVAAGALITPATVGADPTGSRTRTGPDGQTLTVTPADGLDPAGSTLRVKGTGFDTSVGIYLALCVDNGPELAPGPCFGGAAMSGGAGGSYWISSNPPPYAVGLTEPYTEDGSFEFDLHVVSEDENTDCFDPETTCVVATRADHLNSALRNADVKVPVSFAGQDPIEDETDPEPEPEAEETTTTTTTTIATPVDGTNDPTGGQTDDPADEESADVLASSETNAVGSANSAAASSAERTLAYTGARTNYLTALGLTLVTLGIAAGIGGTRMTRRLAQVDSTANEVE